MRDGPHSTTSIRRGATGRGPLALVAVCGAIAVGAAAGWSWGTPPEPSAARDPLALELERRLTTDVRPLLSTYCLSCHSGKEPKGDVNFESLASLADAQGMPDDLSMAREMVTTREMPPKDKPQPTDLERLILTQWLEAMLAYVPPDAALDPGWFTIHRLNRAEYRNTLRDLLGIDPREVDLSARLPRDDTGYGFDNIADVLSTSSLAVEQYLEAADRAIDIGLGPIVDIGDTPRPVRPLKGTAGGNALSQGGYYLYTNGAVQGTFDFPATGDYLIRVEAWETKGGDEHARLSLRIDGREERAFFISGTKEDPQTVEARVHIRAGRRPIAAHFTNDYWKENVADRNLGVEQIAIAGPLDAATTQRSAVWTTTFAPADGINDDEARAGAIIEPFAAKAYRRPVRADERAALLELYRRQRAAGLAFEPAVRLVLTATLVSPNFLYRTVDNPDSGDPSKVYKLNGYELASRLSYFLWSSMPDDALLAAAADGSLTQSDTLLAQTRRMLRDPRADAFIENFSGQWLQLRMLDGLAMDTSRFPEYDDELRSAMLAEARLFFADVVRSDASLLSLLDSDYSYLNERLARFYGVDGVTGREFRRVQLPEGSPRGGILTMGAVLTVTSNTTRTSPVKRGLYVLDQILGAPPPPPPADIPRLEQAPTAGPNATLREQLAAHVANPGCAACHNRLDPLGLSFENFDAIGRWRDSEAGKPIDSSGNLPGGVSLAGSEDLKRLLVSRADQFIEALSGKVLTYAIGRGLEPFDRPAVRQIQERTRQNGDRFASLIEAVVLSDTFRTCRGREQNDE